MDNKQQQKLIGRDAELDFLSRVFTTNGPDVIAVYGIAGIGKSSLINEFIINAKDRKRNLIFLDCQLIKPIEKSFLQSLCQQLDTENKSLAELASYLKQQSESIILVLDQFESFQLLESWFRLDFMPAVVGQVKLIFSGRLKPDKQWVLHSHKNVLFNGLKLNSLSSESAMTYLQSTGLDQAIAREICHFSNGHPLALRLTLAAFTEQPARKLKNIPMNDVIQTLAEYFLEDIKDPVIKQAIESIAVVRRATESILAGMLNIENPAEIYQQLSQIEFIECRPDGLSLHDVLKKALAINLRAKSPQKFSAYKNAAWQVLKKEMKTSNSLHLWRYTADIIYLVDSWVIRDAFFPPTDNREYSIEQAQPHDIDAIMQIVQLHEPKSLHKVYLKWLQDAIEFFHTVRDHANVIVGFYWLIDPAKANVELLKFDPVTSYWWRHLNQSKIAGKRPHSLFIRRWLSLENGEARNGVQAACWVDVKRAYVNMQPDLHQVYMAVQHLEPYHSTAKSLGFTLLDEKIEIDGNLYNSAFLYFGEESVDGWVSKTLMSEMIHTTEVPLWFDKPAHQLVIGNQKIDLTRLEFGTLDMLIDNQGKVISRTELLNKVWNIHYEGASNVVDTIIVTLRKKLGSKSCEIESVRGVGYKLCL